MKMTCLSERFSCDILVVFFFRLLRVFIESRDWTDGSAVKNTCLSFRGPRFDCQVPHQAALPVTPGVHLSSLPQASGHT